MQVPSGNAGAISEKIPPALSPGSQSGKAEKGVIPFARIFAEESAGQEIPPSNQLKEALHEQMPLQESQPAVSEMPLPGQRTSKNADGRSIEPEVNPAEIRRDRSEAEQRLLQGALKTRSEKDSALSTSTPAKKRHTAKREESEVNVQHPVKHSEKIRTGSLPAILLPVDVQQKPTPSIPAAGKESRKPLEAGSVNETNARRESNALVSDKLSGMRSPGLIAEGTPAAVQGLHEDGKSGMAEAPAGMDDGGSHFSLHAQRPLDPSTNEASPIPTPLQVSHSESERVGQANFSPDAAVSAMDAGSPLQTAALRQMVAHKDGQKSDQLSGPAIPRMAKLDRPLSESLSSTQAITAAGANPPNRDMAQHVPDANRTGPTGESAGESNPFQHLDAGETRATLLHANAREVAVGVKDPALGWLEIQTQSSGGHVSASLTAASPEAHAGLAVQAPALAQYLEDRNVHVHTLDIGMQTGSQNQGDHRQDSSAGYAEQDRGSQRSVSVSSAGPLQASAVADEESAQVVSAARISVRA